MDFLLIVNDQALALAKSEVKKAGGNALKLTTPLQSGSGGSCHKIQAKIFKCNAHTADSLSNTNHSANTLRAQDSILKNSNRNTMVAGYQIGGLTLLGLEYEIRFHDYFGINLGGGIKGFTGGVKIHTNPKKNSPFFLLSYKDAGFGLLNTFGAEYGSKWVFGHKNDFGLLFQFGLAKILYIDNAFEKVLYKGKSAPPLTLSIGVGLTW
jgi:hypothetical protein